MAAPDLTQRMTCFVQKQGTDDPSYNAVGSPFSRLTIAAALADLAANYIEPASATNYHIVAVGPGVYVEAGIALPPWTFINGSCDGEGQPTTQINTTADINLTAAWSANATQRGGFQNVAIRAQSGTPHLDFTMPVPSAGNPARTVELFNVRHSLTQEIFEATSTADALRETLVTQDGANTDTFTQIGGASAITQRTSAAAMTIRDKTSFAASGVWQAVAMGAGAGLTASSIAAAGCTLRLLASSPRTLVLNQTAPGVLAFLADAVSFPVRASVSFTGGSPSTMSRPTS